MQEFVKKMIVERDDLKGKIKKVQKAIENPPDGTDKESIDLLRSQLIPMGQYLSILEKRIDKEGGM